MKIKIKIAYVVTPITFGGSEKVNLNFLKYVDRDNFEIVPILVLRPWEPEKPFESELKKLKYNYLFIPVAKSQKLDLFRVLRCFWILLKIIRGNSYDLIHTHGYLADILGILTSKICRIPIISTCHGFIYEGMKLSFYNSFDLFVLKYFRKIITVSEQLKIDLIKHGIVSDKIIVIKNSPTPYCNNENNKNIKNLRKLINVESKEILIGFIGRLSREKGVKFLLESIK